MVFQSPRSGEFVSNFRLQIKKTSWIMTGFNPLDRGNLYLIRDALNAYIKNFKFQSPRSGKFVSNIFGYMPLGTTPYSHFNPLDRGNLYLMSEWWSYRSCPKLSCFNPLDRGNLYLILYCPFLEECPTKD